MKRNTGALATALLALALAFAAGGCASDKPMPGSTAGSFVDDSYLTTAIKTKLLANISLKAFDIKVITDNRVVTLKGKVPTEALRDQAVSVAKSVDGVKSVVSEIEVGSN